MKVVADGKGGTVDPTPEPEPEPEPQPQPTPSGTELYISEYVEGSSNNKYIEIYNPTDKAIDLSVYALDLNSNGGAQWSKETGFAKNNYVKLEGTIEAKATKVYKHSQATIYTGEAIDCNAVNFNGNDPIGLFKNDILIDIIGKFAGGNADFAKDVTLRRKADAAAPSATYDENQWEKAGKDDVTGLGKR